MFRLCAPNRRSTFVQSVESTRTRRGTEMAVTTPQDVNPKSEAAKSDLQETARKHLWMHFSRMGGYDAEHEIPIIARAEGPYVWDDHGKRYLDGLSALFCCNAGHGRPEYAEAAAAQIKELD